MKDAIEIKLRLRYLLLLTIAVLAAVGVLTWLFSRADKDVREIITYGSSLFGATIAILSLLYTAESIRKANAEKKSLAAARFIERWNSPAYLDLKTKWRQLNSELQKFSQEARCERLNQEIQQRTIVVEVLNFFEEMAVSINMLSIDEELLKRFFRTMLLNYFEDYKYWIEEYRRVRNAPKFAVEIETVYRKWKEAGLSLRS